MSFLGGLLGAVGSIFGAKESSSAAEHNNAANLEAQREFAQMGIRWRAADAAAAGLHPMAALGATGASFSPSFQAGATPDYGGAGQALGDFIDGQNTKRSQVATMTPYEKEMQQLALDRARRQNQLLDAQIAAEWSSVLGQPPTPTMPAALGGPTSAVSSPVRFGSVKSAPVGLIKSEPSQSISATPDNASLEAAGTPGFKRFAVTDKIGVHLPNQALSESLEGMGASGHFLGPALTGLHAADQLWNGHGKPSDKALPDGYKWEWSRLKQSWTAVRKR